MPSLIWQILQSRRIESQDDIQRLFSPQLKQLRSPLSLDQMEAAVARLCSAYEKREKVCLYADFDLDGTSGLALLKRGLEILGFENLCHYQPRRLSEGYGLHVSALESLKAQGVQLVVTIDLGITALDGAQRAQQLGLDLIITDHHLPKEQLPQAVALVNPNKGTCPSGMGHLCGAGVAFYLFLALKMKFQERGWVKSEINSKELLDCFVIGTLTDMVPLVEENRVLVKHGLVELARTQRPGLRALLKNLGLWGRPLSAQDVAIRFAPKLNALSRMEQGIFPIDLFFLKSDAEAEEMVAQVVQNNEERVALQAAAEALAEERVLALQAESGETPPCLLVWDESFHPGVVGLVATRLAQKFSRPSFVGALREGMIVGSARGTGLEPGVLAGLERASSALERFGGHAQAAGFEIHPDRVGELFAQLCDFYQSQKSCEGAEVEYYDASGRLPEVTPQMMKWYEGLGPFGAEFELPRFHLDELEVKSLRELRGGHLKLELADRSWSQVRMEALWFSPPPQHQALRSEGLRPGRPVEVLAHPQWNYFNGKQTLQLILEDIR